MSLKVRFHEEAKKELKELPKEKARELIVRLEEVKEANFFKYFKPYKRELQGYYKLSWEGLRLAARVDTDDGVCVEILMIVERSDDTYKEVITLDRLKGRG